MRHLAHLMMKGKARCSRAVGFWTSNLSQRRTCCGQALSCEPATSLLWSCRSYRLQPSTGWQAIAADVPPLDLAAILEGGQPWNHATGEEETAAVCEAKAGCLLAAISLLGRAGEISVGVASFPEIFSGPVAVLKALGADDLLPQVSIQTL